MTSCDAKPKGNRAITASLRFIYSSILKFRAEVNWLAPRNNGADKNTATGFDALYSNLIGTENMANGYRALLNNTGNNNIAVGSSAGSNLTTGDNNIDIGNAGVAGESANPSSTRLVRALANRLCASMDCGSSATARSNKLIPSM